MFFMKRRDFLDKAIKFNAGCVATPLFSKIIPGSLDTLSLRSQIKAPKEGEILYNGIRLPKNWPPSHFDPESDEPMPVPYLKEIPDVILAGNYLLMIFSFQKRIYYAHFTSLKNSKEIRC